MVLLPYTATALSRYDIPDTPNNRNVVQGAIVRVFDLQGVQQTIYDDDTGAGGELQKVTNLDGQRTFYIEPGSYTVDVNGRQSSVNIADASKVRTAIQPVASVADLRLLEATFDGQQVSLTSYYDGWASTIRGPQGGGIFTGYTDISPIDDGGVNIAAPSTQWVRQLGGCVTPEMFGAKGDAAELLDAATNDTAACQAAIDYVYSIGGGEIEVSALYAVAGLDIPQRVICAGANGFFANQYIDNNVRPAGCGFYLIAGSNADAITLKLRVYNDGGVLKETGSNKQLSDYRHFGGMVRCVVYGNRSDTANPPSVTDKNTTGHGIAVEGVRYPILQDIVSMMNAQSGLITRSFDYGVGAISCNNLLFDNISLLNNATNAGSLSGGDSVITKINAGYNALSLSISLSTSRVDGVAWNNEADGVTLNNAERTEIDFKSYDNKRNGFRTSGTKNCVIKGQANANGRNTALTNNERAGVIVSSTCEGLVNEVKSDGTYLGVSYQTYGHVINNSLHSADLKGASATGNFLGQFNITDITKALIHGSLPNGASHPGFVSTGAVDLNANPLRRASVISANSWSSVSVSAGTLATGSQGFIAVSNASPENVTDITSSAQGLPVIHIRVSGAGAITFVYNSAKLRLNGKTDRVLTTGESISFIYVSGTVWQEV